MRTWSMLSILILMLGFAGAANALTINFGTDDLSNVSGATLTPSGGSYTVKTVGGVTGVGITTGYEGTEMDGENESILIEFDTPQIIESLVLGFLYQKEPAGPKSAYGDKVDERAWMSINGETGVYTLKATGDTSGTWDGSGALSNVEAALYNSGGAWLLTNPFGTTAVTSILFTAPIDRHGPQHVPWTQGKGSDYSLVSLTTSSVPVPAAVWLLGSGLLGLVGLRRRRRS